MLDIQNKVFHLERKLVGVAIRTAAPVCEPLNATFLIAIEDLVSGLARNAEGAAAQRQRWEQGHLHILLTEALPCIWTAVRKGNWWLLALSLDAAVPPITLLGLLIAGLLLVSCVTALVGGHIGPLVVSSTAPGRRW